jgi:hypothetical protein
VRGHARRAGFQADFPAFLVFHLFLHGV